jgi:hypothetical protein
VVAAAFREERKMMHDLQLFSWWSRPNPLRILLRTVRSRNKATEEQTVHLIIFTHGAQGLVIMETSLLYTECDGFYFQPRHLIP